MKLSLQLAGASPANGKPAPIGLPGVDEFGTTMQATMAVLPSVRTSPTGTSPAATDMQPPGAKTPAIVSPQKASKGLAAECGEVIVPAHEPQIGGAFPITVVNDLLDPNESREVRSTESANGPVPAHEVAAEPPAPELISDERDIKTSLLGQQQYLISERGKELQPPLAATLSRLFLPIEDTSSRTHHKVEEAKGGEGHPATNDPPSNALLVSQSVPIVVPAVAFHPTDLKAAPSTSGSGAKRSHVDLNGISDRSSTLLPALVGADPQDGSNPTSGAAMITQPQVRVGPIGDQFVQATALDTMTSRSTGEQLVPVMTGKAYAGVAKPASQDHPPQAPIHAEFVNNASQIDTRVPKANERRSEAEQELQIAAVGLRHVPPAAITAHPAVTQASEAVFHIPQKITDIHRPQVTTAQVLQRMDLAAPSGAIQLRAETRRLEVGVSTGALGWVEVRATTAASGRVDAIVQVQNDSSAHVLASQSREIADYAREHSVFLGELSVGVGTGDGARGESSSTHSEERSGNATQSREPRPQAKNEQTYGPVDTVSFISVRA